MVHFVYSFYHAKLNQASLGACFHLLTMLGVLILFLFAAWYCRTISCLNTYFDLRDSTHFSVSCWAWDLAIAPYTAGHPLEHIILTITRYCGVPTGSPYGLLQGVASN